MKMAGLNKVMLIGNLGRDPEVRESEWGRVCNLNIATSESWKDKQSGERKTKTEWHKVVIYNEGLVGVAERFLQKGSTVYIEGQLQTRSYDKDGENRYVTEIVLQKYKGELTMLGKKDSPDGGFHAPIAPSMRKIETDDDFDF